MATVIFVAASMAAQEAMFPEPLHLTRRITEPFSENSVIVEEFCQADRIVTVVGPVTSIADYGAGTLTRIDRDARTVSVTSFEELAKARLAAKGKRPGQSESRWKLSTSPKPADRANIQRLTIERPTDDGRQELEVSSDSSILIYRSGAEALLGFRFPSMISADVAELILGAMQKDGRPGDERVALPVVHRETYLFEGEEIETRSEVIRVGRETIDPRLMEIPPGSIRVALEGLHARRKLEEADNPSPR